MYKYTMIDDTHFEVTATRYKAIFNGNETLAQDTVTKMNNQILDQARNKKIKELHNKYQKEYSEYLKQYPKREVDSFQDKKAEALAYSLDPTVSTPVIDAIVDGIGDITKDEYVSSVLEKVIYLSKQEGVMVGIRDKIKACETEEDLYAIEI